MEVLKTSPSAMEHPAAGGLRSSAPRDASAAADDRSSVKHLVVLLLILAVGAGVRLALWTWFDGQPLHIADEQDYDLLGRNLAEHGEYALTPGQPDSLRPPLYPLIVAGVYRAFGLENYQAVRLLQALLSLVTVLLVYRLGTVVLSRKAGLWAAGFYAFYPSLLGYNNLLLTEVLFTLFVCGFCLLLVLALRRDSLPYLAAAAAVMALAALTRSVLWLFPPVLAVFLLLAFRGSWRRRLSASLTFVVVFAAVLAPWAIRNTLLQKTFIAIDVMGGRNFMMGNYEYTPLYRSWAVIELQDERSWIYKVTTTFPPERPRTQGEIDKLAMRLAIQFVVDNPGLTLQRDVVKFFDFWGLERELVAGADRGFFGQLSRPVVIGLGLLICGSYVLALFLGLFGIVLAPPDDRRIHLFLLLLMAFVCGLHTLAFGHSRYHLPLMPLILIYAAGAVVRWRDIWAQRRRWSFRLACGLCVLFVAGWLWEMIAVDPDRIRQLLHSIA